VRHQQQRDPVERPHVRHRTLLINDRDNRAGYRYNCSKASATKRAGGDLRAQRPPFRSPLLLHSLSRSVTRRLQKPVKKYSCSTTTVVVCEYSLLV